MWQKRSEPDPRAPCMCRVKGAGCRLQGASDSGRYSVQVQLQEQVQVQVQVQVAPSPTLGLNLDRAGPMGLPLAPLNEFPEPWC